MDIKYLDDRLYLISVFPASVQRNQSGLYETTIFYDHPEEISCWVVVTYENKPHFPIYSVRHFKQEANAIVYLQAVEPSTPLLSLNGRPPAKPLQYPEYVAWKKSLKLMDFDPDRAYSSEGQNRREFVVSSNLQFG